MRGPSFDLPDPNVGLADRLGQAESAAAVQDVFDGARPIDPVSGGDVQRPHACPRSHDRTHDAPLEGEGNTVARIGADLVVLTDEPALRASDRRNAEQKAQMGGETHAARMRDSLAVADQEIRPQA